MSWRIVFTNATRKDAKKIARSHLKPQVEEILAIITQDPWQTPPPCERLLGDLAGAYSRRINIQQRWSIRFIARKKRPRRSACRLTTNELAFRRLRLFATYE